MAGKYTEAQARATKKYSQSKSQIKFLVDKDKADAYKQYAAEQEKPLSTLITELLYKEMEKH